MPKMTKDQMEAACDGRLLDNQGWSTLVLDPGEADVNILWMRRGFDAWETGGGCMAWRMDLDGDRYLMVTDEDGFTLPDCPDAPVLVGMYKGEDGEEDGPCREFPSSGAAWAALEAEGHIEADPVPALVAFARDTGRDADRILAAAGGIDAKLYGGGGLFAVLSLMLEGRDPSVLRGIIAAS